MEARLFISQTLDGYRVMVLVPGPPCRSWNKVYESKAHCLTEIAYVELAPPGEVAEAMETELGGEIAAIMIRSDVEPMVLRAAGFVEDVKEYVN
jgi:hypothetical protein